MTLPHFLLEFKEWAPPETDFILVRVSRMSPDVVVGLWLLGGLLLMFEEYCLALESVKCTCIIGRYKLRFE